MNDSDIRSIKGYLHNCLDPNLKFAEGHVAKYAQDETEATDFLSADLAGKMRRFYEGQAVALRHAINDYRERFAEELKRGE